MVAPRCQHCGRALVGEEADPKRHRTVKRRVRPGHTYGDSPAGAVVEVEARDLSHPAVAAATTSLKEWADAEKAVRAKTRAEPAKGLVAKMVEAQLEGAAARVRAEVETAKRLRAPDQEPVAAEHR